MKINHKEISIIGGAGHVGFPLGLVFASKNFKVNLIDKNKDFLTKINKGLSPFLEQGAKSLMKKCLGKFKDFERVHRGIDVNGLKYSIRKVQKEYENIKKTDDFNNNLIPDLI